MRNMGIAIPFILLIDCIVFINFFKYQAESVYEFEQRQQDLWVNYSVDAAVQEMLSNSEHIGTDYATWGEMTIEPEVALYTYKEMLMRNLGWSPSEKNKEDLVENSIPFFIVAAYDGYYVYCRQKEIGDIALSSGQTIKDVITYPMVWTPKLPYSDTVGSGDTTKYYFYNLGDMYYGTFSDGVLKYDNKLSKTSTGAGSYAQAQMIIAERLTEAANSALYSGLQGEMQQKWFIPNSFSQWSNSNPVRTPSILTYISRQDQGTKFDVVTFGVGGAKVDEANFVICYNVNGNPLYTYAYNRDKLPVIHPGVSVKEVLTSPKEAAKRGYYFDLKFMEE